MERYSNICNSEHSIEFINLVVHLAPAFVPFNENCSTFPICRRFLFVCVHHILQWLKLKIIQIFIADIMNTLIMFPLLQFVKEIKYWFCKIGNVSNVHEFHENYFKKKKQKWRKKTNNSLGWTQLFPAQLT